jgi:hypothetical protein
MDLELRGNEAVTSMTHPFCFSTSMRDY